MSRSLSEPGLARHSTISGAQSTVLAIPRCRLLAAACSLRRLPHRPLEDGKSIAVGMRKEKKVLAEEGAVDGYTFKVSHQALHELD